MCTMHTTTATTLFLVAIVSTRLRRGAQGQRRPQCTQGYMSAQGHPDHHVRPQPGHCDKRNRNTLEKRGNLSCASQYDPSSTVTMSRAAVSARWTTLAKCYVSDDMHHAKPIYVLDAGTRAPTTIQNAKSQSLIPRYRQVNERSRGFPPIPRLMRFCKHSRQINSGPSRRTTSTSWRNLTEVGVAQHAAEQPCSGRGNHDGSAPRHVGVGATEYEAFSTPYTLGEEPWRVVVDGA
jgi:hypothetical protein